MNMGDTRKSVRALFDEAAEVESTVARRTFLDRECDGDAALRAEVEELLRAHERAGGFLADPTRETSGDVAAVSLKEGDRVGRYQLLEKIGEGGCGVVYLAEQTEPVRRRVALKVIKLGMDTRSVITRFEAERQALALMDHPNIARVLDAGATETGRPFFVMELVCGIKITDYCAQHRLSTSTRLRLFTQVCQAVQHAHQKGIIHRDLKPSNVLVTSSDGTPLPKVIDFGVAKATAGVQLTDEALLTRVGLLVGTPAYMSPEQAELGGADVDTRTDIYSLGVLLYELLTGHPPFDTDTWLKSGIDALRKAIRETPPKRPSTRLALELADSRDHQPGPRNPQEIQRAIQSVRGDLDWIVLKALEKDRARRYETANAFAMDIQRHLNNEPVVARPPSPAYLLQKSFRRHRPAFLAAAAVALLLVAGVVFATRDAARTHRAEKVQRELREKAEANQKQAELARNEADAANRILKRNLFIREWLEAETLVDEGKTTSALAWFARAARQHPDDAAVQTRLLSLLTEATFVGPVERTVVHGAPVNNFAFLSDERLLATAGDDRMVRLWKLDSGSSSLVFSNRFESPEVAVAAGPDALVVDDTGSVSLWNSNRQVRVVPVSHRINRRLPISADGRLAVIHDEPGNAARVWDIAELKPGERAFPDCKPLSVFSPDGKYLVGGGFAQLLAWEISSGRLVWQTPPTFRGQGVVEAEVQPDGKSVIASCWLGSEGGELSGWTFEPVMSSAGGPATASSEGWLVRTRSPIGAWCFSKDGGELYVSDAEGRLGIVNLTTHELQMLNGQHDGRVTWMRLSRDGQWLATASVDGTVRFWDARMKSPSPLLVTNTVGIRIVKWSPDSKWFACNGADGLELRDAQSGALLKRLPLDQPMGYLDLSRDGRRIVAIGSKGRTQVWDAQSGAPLFPPIQYDADGYVMFARDVSRFLIVSGSRTLRVCETETGRQIGPTLTNSTRAVSVTFGPDDRSLVVMGDMGTIEIWSWPAGQLLQKIGRHKDIVWGARPSPDGKFVLSASRDRTAALWEADTGRLVREFRHEQQVYRAMFSPDGTRIVTGDSSHKAHVWDARSGQRLFSLPAHAGNVWFCQFSSDGQMLLTGDDAGNSRLWDASSGLPLSGWIRHGRSLKGNGLTADGRMAMSLAEDASVRLWPVVRAPLPAPNWLPELAETLAGRRLRDDAAPELVPAEQWPALESSLRSLKGDDFYTRWARWFFVERFKEHPTPFVP